MKCKPLYLGNLSIGDRFGNESMFVLFGNRHLSADEFGRLFPEKRLVHSKQVHGNTVRQIEENLSCEPEADALLTHQDAIALCVYTADCLPIMFFDPQNRQVAACHAGWRGLVNKIIKETLNQMKSDPQTVQVWIGPHIHKDSFEVGHDVAESLAASASNGHASVFRHPTDSEKRLVDLSLLAKNQLLDLGISDSNIWIHPTNTFDSPDLLSYRKQKNPGRLLNLIWLE